MRHKGFIFDLDGTLLDSMDVWAQIDERFLAKRGLPVPEDYINQICARSFEEAAIYTIGQFHMEDTVQSIIDEWNEMALYEYSHHVGLTAGAWNYLNTLKAAEKKLAIATALPRSLFEPCLRNNGIFELFDVICSTEECRAGKGSPEFFTKVAQKLGVRPAECVVFEDVLPAVKSAKCAGMQVYGIYDKYSENDRNAIIRIADGYFYSFHAASEMLKENGDV